MALHSGDDLDPVDSSILRGISTRNRNPRWIKDDEVCQVFVVLFVNIIQDSDQVARQGSEYLTTTSIYVPSPIKNCVVVVVHHTVYPGGP
uniref:Uncharacterized protein n=1 Tax=Oryza glaberrima TaxID=4538 RepID=A0A679BA08_ORYGL|nr:hypothetical protein [Oryza glaberrima]BBF89450.1 hypothetical protein [Oryza glaberrima]